jgi:hypothetical protein
MLESIVLAAVLLMIAPANRDLGSPGLVVTATSSVHNEVASALNLRDIEHYVVAELIHHRVENVVPASSLASSLSSLPADTYQIEFSIEQAEEAWRPRWNWTEQRYVDDDVLHLELSITLIRTRDGVIVGGLYDIHDYRAEDFGSFSTPQAVRAAAYKAASKLADDFVLASTQGEFGERLRTIQRADTPADVVNDWSELSADWKFATALIAVVVFILLLGLAIRIVYAILHITYCILVPQSLRPAPALPPPVLYAPRPPRKPMPVVEAEPEPEEEEEEESPSRE